MVVERRLAGNGERSSGKHGRDRRNVVRLRARPYAPGRKCASAGCQMPRRWMPKDSRGTGLEPELRYARQGAKISIGQMVEVAKAALNHALVRT